jgi:hypothetical protein
METLLDSEGIMRPVSSDDVRTVARRGSERHSQYKRTSRQCREVLSSEEEEEGSPLAEWNWKVRREMELGPASSDSDPQLAPFSDDEWTHIESSSGPESNEVFEEFDGQDMENLFRRSKEDARHELRLWNDKTDSPCRDRQIFPQLFGGFSLLRKGGMVF